MNARATGRRLTLATMASALVTATAVAASASPVPEEPEARPEVEMGEFEPADFTEQAGRLPRDLVVAVERDLDLSPEQYLAQAATARAATDVIASLGDAVSSAWLAGRDLHVVVKDRSDESLAAAAGATVHVGDALTDAATAARSQGRVVYIDRRAEEVVPVEEDLLPVSARSSRAPDPDARSEDDTLRGGFGYWTDDDLYVYECTAAFTGVLANGSSAALTAGHCTEGESGPLDRLTGLLGLSLTDDDGEDDGDGSLTEGDDTGDSPVVENTEHDGEQEDEQDADAGEEALGGFVDGASRYGDGHDTALVAIAASWTVRPEVSAVDDEQAPGEGLEIFDSIPAITGAPACSGGAASGWTCGRILATNTEAPVGDEIVTGFMFDACTVPGDGGAPVVIGNYALGTVSGSTMTDADCAERDRAESSHVALGYALAGAEHSAFALYEDEWSLSIYVGTPEVTAPVEGDVTGQQPTIRGRIDAAAGTTVTVTVGGADPVEAEVRADGRWRAPLEDSLTAGEHSYSVTARHTPTTGGETTVSETVTGSFEVDEVAALVVATPADREATSSTRPRFSGTGEPRARISLKFDDQTTTTVVDDDGAWTVTPREARRAGRFDATITQLAGDTEDETIVEGIGIVPGAPLVSDISGGVSNGYVVLGTAMPGSTVAARVEPFQPEDSGEPTASAREHVAQADESGGWEVNLGDLPPGKYTVSAVQAVDDLISERSAAATVDVVGLDARGTRAADPDDLAETGTSPAPFIAVAAILFTLGGSTLFWRRRRSTSPA
ncbi:LPXTG cell wall anchor domain-containing protein [Phytoactinopolyspora alkaliphila]|uniref:LPXTG cell wall anchor domain-containing protein n=1 Tax=Phytoactinopolyspora alkaliphila TaxID=1783498 RepID=A0A6N9YQN2_9ACTN|nr:Ig-like domain-containing protein [Phytoactinopolyspora alkaliphila]NED97274.1 LPXTG cell wall anchor domain-containing protein [Phytoactinopolyspora alkaliphila]